MRRSLACEGKTKGLVEICQITGGQPVVLHRVWNGAGIVNIQGDRALVLVFAHRLPRVEWAGYFYSKPQRIRHRSRLLMRRFDLHLKGRLTFMSHEEANRFDLECIVKGMAGLALKRK